MRARLHGPVILLPLAVRARSPLLLVTPVKPPPHSSPSPLLPCIFLLVHMPGLASSVDLSGTEAGGHSLRQEDSLLTPIFSSLSPSDSHRASSGHFFWELQLFSSGTFTLSVLCLNGGSCTSLSPPPLCTQDPVFGFLDILSLICGSLG